MCRFRKFRSAILSLQINSVSVLLAVLVVGLPLPATADDESITWHAVSAADVEGKGWSDTKHPFDRLPAKAEQIVRPPVWELAQHSAGIYVDFVSDAPAIFARWTSTSERLAMPHMPATGVSGVDLYLQRDGNWHFVGTGQPRNLDTNEAKLTAGLEPKRSEFRLYFSLYNGVSEVAVGVPEGASFDFVEAADHHVAPVVIYGTSITQGGCASRPGMSYSAILGRRLNVPVVNLGFSGNGKAEPEVARLLAELDPSAFVLDPLPNLFPDEIAKRLPEFIDILRERRPEVPILLLTSPLFPDMPYVDSRAERVNGSNQQLQKIYDQRVAAGDRRLWLVPPCDFTTDGGEATVDGVHPTDLGFVRIADNIEPHLRKALLEIEIP